MAEDLLDFRPQSYGRELAFERPPLSSRSIEGCVDFCNRTRCTDASDCYRGLLCRIYIPSVRALLDSPRGGTAAARGRDCWTRFSELIQRGPTHGARTSPESNCATARLFTISTNSRGASNTRTTFSSAMLTKRRASRKAALMRSYPCTCGRAISCHTGVIVVFPSWVNSCGIAPCMRVV